ncbi:MAG: hypothetical protein IPO68_03345 [Chitinophagaceae bacterium]|nr:hypothetical protein [Chitinophagaceae bacterium]
MRKKIFLSIFSGVISFCAHSQLIINNAVFFIQSGATVTVQGDVTSNVDIQGTGLLQLKGSTSQNVDMGGFTIPNLEIDNTANVTLLNTNARIGSSLTLTNGRLRLGNQNLRIASSITSVAGVSSAKFIETNGSGVLTKEGLNTTAFVYPVGFSGTEFNPLSITNTGTTDDISVRCLQNVLTNGLSGAPIASDFANNSWVVTEAVAGGSNLSLSGEWVLGDELPGFNRAKSGIARYNSGTDWDLPASNVLAANGSGPYNRNRSSVVTPGVFAVADLEKVNAARLNLKVFLQGNYNATTGLMGDALRTTNVIPTVQPYSSAINARFTRVGVYDGTASVNETVPNTGVFDVTGTNDDIVDWVYVSLLDGTTPATKLQTRAALLQRDGDVVEYNAISGTYVPLSMPIDGDGNYHILIGHRNHLSVRTPLAQSLQDNVDFTYNFSSAQAQAFQNGSIPTNAAMASITGTFPAFALWGGNVNANNNVRYTGPSPDNNALLTLLGGNTTTVLNGIYSLGDLNLNGNVRYTGPSPDNTTLLNVLSGNTTAVRTEHQ